MRDVNLEGNIQAGRDVHIGDHNEYKPLAQCTNEELIAEETHRKKILRKEQNRRSKFTWRILGLCGVALLIAAGWYLIQGKINVVSVVVGAAAVLVGYANLHASDTPNEFERRQLAALNEITMLLRERGSR